MRIAVNDIGKSANKYGIQLFADFSFNRNIFRVASCRDMRFATRRVVNYTILINQMGLIEN